MKYIKTSDTDEKHDVEKFVAITGYQYLKDLDINGTIRYTADGYLSAHDVIATLNKMDKKSMETVYQRFCESEQGQSFTVSKMLTVRMGGRGNHGTPCFHYNDLVEFIMIMPGRNFDKIRREMAKDLTSLLKKEVFCDLLGVDTLVNQEIKQGGIVMKYIDLGTAEGDKHETDKFLAITGYQYLKDLDINGTIRYTSCGKISAHDVIMTLNKMDKKTTKTVYQRFCESEQGQSFTVNKMFTVRLGGRGNRETPCLHYNDLVEFIMIMSGRNFDKKRSLMC